MARSGEKIQVKLPGTSLLEFEERGKGLFIAGYPPRTDPVCVASEPLCSARTDVKAAQKDPNFCAR